MTAVVESKVAWPAVATGCLAVLGGAIYRLILAFHWFHPDAGEKLALTALGAAILYVVNVAVGYLAPHTSRPDLAPKAPAPTVSITGGPVLARPRVRNAAGEFVRSEPVSRNATEG